MDVKDLESLDCPYCQTILEFTRKFLISIDPVDRRKFIKVVSDSRDTFVKFVNLVDNFTRDSKTFKTLTKIHTWGFKNRVKYKKIYMEVVNSDQEDVVEAKTSFNPDDYLLGDL